MAIVPPAAVSHTPASPPQRCQGRDGNRPAQAWRRERHRERLTRPPAGATFPDAGVAYGAPMLCSNFRLLAAPAGRLFFLGAGSPADLLPTYSRLATAG
jgi:hypothetical protein